MQALLLILLFILLFAGIASGIPVMFALLGVPVLVALFASLFGAFDLALFSALPTRIFGILENPILYAVPLFIVMGKLLEHSNLAESALRMMLRDQQGANASGELSGRPIAISVIGLSVVIACSSGIVGATIVMLGTIALPIMLKSGLGEKLSAGLIIASGSLGQLLPPSIVLVLLADQISNAHLAAQRELGNFAPDPVTIGHVFAGAIVPGILLAMGYTAYLFFRTSRQKLPKQEPRATSTVEVSQNKNWMGFAAILSLLAVPVAILSGIATPTEAGGIGALLMFLLLLANGQRKTLPLALKQSLDLTGVIYGIIIGASVFALVVRGLDGDELISSLLQNLSDNPQLALVIALAIIFVIGFLMEFVEITYVVVPLAAPPLFALGIDPLWFAVLLAVNLQISFLTPPMGISLFYYKSVADIRTTALYRAVIPFIAIQLFVLVAIFAFPSLAVWLPGILI